MIAAGEVAVVTGGNAGLGLAIADALTGSGVVVIRAGLEPATGENMRTVDVRSADAVESLMDEVVRDHGRVDIMVNNAGLGAIGGSSIELEPEYWDAVIGTNLTGAWNGCRAAIRHMLTQPTGGRIVNISSRLAFSAGGPGRAAYAASKAAVSNLTRQLAVEYGRRGIRVNAVCPGFIPGTSLTPADTSRIELAREQTPSTRLGTAQDVARAVAFLASAESEFINGHNLVVDGGASVRS